MPQYKIALCGANGMLGHALQHVFAKHQLVLLDHDTLDITNWSAVEQVLGQIKPDIIINAAAYTAVDDCESNAELAWQVNATGPQHLARFAKHTQATLIHYSTDYVFAGDQSTGYKESDPAVGALNVYGQSKAAGEQAIQQQADISWQHYYIIRTAWLYGPHGKNFVDTMINLGKTKPNLKVVNDQIGCPTYTVDLASQTQFIVEHKLPFGVYHVTNSGQCSWYEFAQEIFRLHHLTIPVEPCATSDFPRPAHRPPYSILLNTKLPPLRSWAEALAAYTVTIELTK